MNSISEQLLQAMDIIVNEKVSKLEFDKTIQAKIYKIENVDTGEYKVKYNGNIFSAYSNNLQETYKVDDLVYVTVPEGNFSNKKIITDLVAAKSLSASQLMALQNSIFEISPSFNILYGQDYDSEKPYGVIAGIPLGNIGSYNEIFKGSDTYQQNSYHGLFQQYAAQYDLIRIKASFMTQFFDEHDRGNYGIEVQFYAKNLEGYEIVSYTLDLNDFNGDPYHYSVFSPQWTIIKTQKNYLLGLKSIKLFEKEFEYDRIYENGVATNKKNTTVANIFAKDISLQFVEQKDLSDTNYYLMISAPKGIAFTENISSLELVGRVIHEGKNVMDESTCKCQWYVRDLSIMIGDELYDKNAGFGWRKLDKQAGSSLSLVTSDIKYQQKYKLSVVYNETIVLSSEIELYNNNVKYSYQLNQTTNNEDIKLLITNNLQNGELVGDWYLSYPDGTYLQLDNGKKKNSIIINQYLKYSSIIFYCAIYDYSKTNIVGTLEYTVTNSDSNEDISISYIGVDTFRYDANGNIDMDLAEQEKTIQAILAWKEGTGTAYTITWIMYDDKGKEFELDGHVYNPSLSMIEEVWVDNGNILHYNIRKKYVSNFNNNTLSIKIKTIHGDEYKFNKEIIFLKDGDQGTNGLTYVIVIRPCNNNGLKLSGFQPLIYNNGWKNTLPLRCYVYKDGEFINNNSKYTINYKWTGVNISFAEEESVRTDRVTARGEQNLSSSSVTTNSSNLQFYVKAQVDINDHTNERKVSIYASYPVDIAVGGIEVNKVDISTIPSYIKYTPSGVNPTFYNNNINFIYKNNTLNDSIKSLNTNILDIEDRDGLKYLKPASSFIFENIRSNLESNVGVLKLPYNNTQYILHSIIMYLDNYSNEAINGWDGTKLETGGTDENGNPTAIFAPQIGAGEKDSYNRFTGVVMGKDSSQDYIGLYGYQAGMNTFGLREDGKAYFGAKAGGGQIIIDGRYATLTGGDVELNNGKPQAAANGMYIVLADKNNGPNVNQNVKSSTKAIGIGLSTHKNEAGVNVTEENFYVTFDGKLRATEANIQGKIYAISGQIGGEQRQGGWTIVKNRIQSGSQSNFVALDSTPINNNDYKTYFAFWAGKQEAGTAYNPNAQKVSEKIANPAPFVVTKDGFLHATNANIKGSLEADVLIANTAGTIGGWIISKDGLSYDNDSIYIKPGSGIKFKDTFNVTEKGVLTSTAGTIGGWIISKDGLSYDNDSIYIKPGSGIKFKDTFNVTEKGVLTSTAGNIGGWTITAKDGLEFGDTIYISPTKGIKYKDTFNVTKDGVLTSTSGVIGGWTIDGRAGLKLGEDIYVSPTKGIKYYEKFTVSKDGVLTSTAGSIAGWDITKNKLSKTGIPGETFNIGMASKGQNVFWVGEGIDETTANIKIDDKAKFVVTKNGKVYCSDVEMKGKLEASSGKIGGWEIGENGLIYKDPSNPATRNKWLYFTPDEGIQITNVFSVDKNGVLTSTAGKIGGWSIEANRLVGRDVSGSTVIVGLDSTKPTKSIYDSSFSSTEDGPSYFAIWSGKNTPGSAYNPNAVILKDRITSGAPFVVTKDGFVQMTNAYVKGTIEADEGQIGHWKLKNGVLVSTNRNGEINGKAGISSRGTYRFWVNADGVDEYGNPTSFPTNDSYFSVDSSGNMHCKNAYVDGTVYSKSGNIGGWRITGDSINGGTITNGEVTIDSDGIRFPGYINDRVNNWSIFDRNSSLKNYITGRSDGSYKEWVRGLQNTYTLTKDAIDSVYSADDLIDRINSGSMTINQDRVKHPSSPTSLPAVYS